MNSMSGYLLAIDSNIGFSLIQYEHHGAQKSATTSFFEISNYELLVLYLKTYTLSLYLDHIVLNFYFIPLLIVGSDRVHHFVHKLRQFLWEWIHPFWRRQSRFLQFLPSCYIKLSPMKSACDLVFSSVKVAH